MTPCASLPHEVVKKRWLGFLIWETITSTVFYIAISLIFPFPALISIAGALYFIAFKLSLFLFSFSLLLLCSPSPDLPSSLPLLAYGFFRVFLRILIGGASDYSPDLRHSAWRTFSKCLFLFICVLSGFLSTMSVCGRVEPDAGVWLIGLGINGSILGLLYGLHFLYHERWILHFPIIQRPFFYRFKMGLFSSLRQALKVSLLTLLSSLLMILFSPDQFKRRGSIGTYIIYLINLYAGFSLISFIWELSTHLISVVHTKRFHFSPPRGSAATEMNPSEWLLEALEQSSPRSILKHLAFLDLCMVSENNSEPWRRAAFFEETGETYRRVISLCLRPLEHLTSVLAEGIEGSAVNKVDQFSLQLNPSIGTNANSDLHAVFNDFQLYSWSVRTSAALTARSHSEDRYGVAQLSGSNAAVLSTLLFTLLAVEACMGKKTSPQPVHSISPASIRWATPSTARHDGVITVKRGSLLYAKAYAMSDILRTSIYQIIFAFQADMQSAAKGSTLEKNWIALGKPLYGTREVLLQKLHHFLGYCAC